MKTPNANRHRSVKLKQVATLFLVSAMTGWTGYYLGAMRETSAIQLPLGATVSADYLASARSFSEVEQARAVVAGLGARYVENAQALIAQEFMSRNPNFDRKAPSSGQSMLAAIKLLDEAIPQFKGTEVEMQLRQTLLFALRHQEQYDRWLDVYLDALYRHPTHELVSAHAVEAARISERMGRDREFAAALRYLDGLPPDFPAASRIEQSLICARAGNHAHEAHEHSL